MRRWGIVLAVLGVLMLVAGAVLRFVVVPRAQVLPADTDETVTYTGDLTTMDVAALIHGDTKAAVTIPVTVERTIKVLKTSGDKARVSDLVFMTSSEGTVPTELTATQYFYAIDRSSLEAVANFTDKSVTEAKGLVVGFPIGTEKKSYTGWVAEVGTTASVKYVGQSELKGLTVYQFEGRLTAPMPKPPAPAALGPPGAPTALLRADLPGLARALELPAATQQQLAQMLPSLPILVPLTYSFTEGDTYSVEPATGRIVDMTKNVRITVGISGLLPPMQVLALGIKYDPASVTAMADRAKDERAQRQIYGMWLPLGVGVVGLTSLALSVPMLRRRLEGASVERRERDRVTAGTG